jgi:cation diffusion facilitator CzcD-associated flavoprotein CzcO
MKFLRCSPLLKEFKTTFQRSSFGLQVPKQLYEFCDFKFNKPDGYYPSGAEVQKYIEDYATANDLHKHVRLRTTVVKATAQDGGEKGWKLTLKDNSSDVVTEETVDYLIVST